MRRVTFEKVLVKSTKYWKDEHGKPRQKTKEFFQTVNPFNKNADGTVKSREEIRGEIVAERNAWLQEGRT